MSNHTSIVLIKSTDMYWWVVHDWGQIFISKKLVQSAVIEGSIDANHASKKHVFHPFLFDQKSIKSQEAHDVWDVNLSGCISLVFKNNAFEQLQ